MKELDETPSVLGFKGFDKLWADDKPQKLVVHDESERRAREKRSLKPGSSSLNRLLHADYRKRENIVKTAENGENCQKWSKWTFLDRK